MGFKIMILTIAIAFVCVNYAFAAEERNHDEHAMTAVEVGNTACPVSGESVEAMGGGSQHEYNGKVYNLCCPGCKDLFEKDPAKYSKIAEESVKS